VEEVAERWPDGIRGPAARYEATKTGPPVTPLLGMAPVPGAKKRSLRDVELSSKSKRPKTEEDLKKYIKDYYADHRQDLRQRRLDSQKKAVERAAAGLPALPRLKRGRPKGKAKPLAPTKHNVKKPGVIKRAHSVSIQSGPSSSSGDEEDG